MTYRPTNQICSKLNNHWQRESSREISAEYLDSSREIYVFPVAFLAEGHVELQRSLATKKPSYFWLLGEQE